MAMRWWLLLAGVPVAVATLWAAGAAESVPVSIRLFGYDRVSGDVVAYADGPVAGKGFSLREPDRWVVDIPNAVYTGALKTLAAAPGSGIRQIRIGQFTRQDVRVVFDLERAMEIPIRPEQRQAKAGPNFRLVFDLPAPRAATEIKRAQLPDQPKAGPTPRAEAPRKVVAVARPAPPRPPEPRPETPAPAAARESGEAAGERFPPVTPALSARNTGPMAAPTPASPGWSWLGGVLGGADAGADPNYTDPHAREFESGEEEPKPVPVSGLTLRRAGKGWIMRITAEKPIDYKLARLGRRDRVYVDVLGGTVDIPRESMYVDNGLLARVKKGAMHGGDTRIVLELDQPLRYEAHLSADRRSVILDLSRSEPRAIPGLSEDRITVDPGHGGNDPGTVGPAGTYEKTVTLAVATKLDALLAKAGLDVQLTRNRDTDLMLWPRVDMGDEFKSDAFVSIHMNSSPNRATQGIETYYFTPESIPLARSIHRKLVAQLGQPDRGLRRANFVVVKYSRMPAVLVEVGYLSNAREETLLGSADYQLKAAEAIRSGVQDYLGSRIARR